MTPACVAPFITCTAPATQVDWGLESKEVLFHCENNQKRRNVSGYWLRNLRDHNLRLFWTVPSTWHRSEDRKENSISWRFLYILSKCSLLDSEFFYIYIQRDILVPFSHKYYTCHPTSGLQFLDTIFHLFVCSSNILSRLEYTVHSSSS